MPYHIFQTSHTPELERLAGALDTSDAIVVGAGAGLSTAAGFTYGGERFERYFADFRRRHGFRDMYSGGFGPFVDEAELWAYWSRFILINRYVDPPRPVYRELAGLLAGREHFVITTNVDSCFAKAGIAPDRLFCPQGDYGLWQCGVPCHLATYGNRDAVRQMVEAQGYSISEDGELLPPAEGVPAHRIPEPLVPHCPVCGEPMAMNLRVDGPSSRTRPGTARRRATAPSSSGTRGSACSSSSSVWAGTPPASSSTRSGA